MGKIAVVCTWVLIAFQPALVLADAIVETLTIKSPSIINSGDVVVVLATLRQTPSTPTYTLSSWSPNITVQTIPATTPQDVHFLYTSSFYSMMTEMVQQTDTLLRPDLAALTAPGGAIPVDQAAFTFSFLAPAPGVYDLIDSGTRQDSLGTENNGASTQFIVGGAVVPEPASLSLVASGALAASVVGMRRIRFRRRSRSRLLAEGAGKPR
jgi:hypothetical protein